MAISTAPREQARARGRALQAALFYRRSSWGNLLFVLPALLLFGAFIFYPVAAVFYLSWFRWDGLSGPRVFVGLANFGDVLLNDPIFYVTLRNTLIYLLVGSAPCILGGFVLACALRRQGRINRLLRSIVFLPYVVPAVVVAQIWAWILQPDYGTLNSLLQQSGHADWALVWLGDAALAMPVASLIAAWVGLGFTTVVYLAGLGQIPEDIYEVMRLDGASWPRQMRSVLFPLLARQTITLTILSVTNALREFTFLYVLTKGGPDHQTELPSLHIFDVAFNLYQQGYASALATVLFVLTLLVTAAQLWYYRRATDF
jgi:raffinose/stachyose/melibiose transport system permease protein